MADDEVLDLSSTFRRYGSKDPKEYELGVSIQRTGGTPSTCEVTLDGRLVWTGTDASSVLATARSGGCMVDDGFLRRMSESLDRIDYVVLDGDLSDSMRREIIASIHRAAGCRTCRAVS